MLGAVREWKPTEYTYWKSGRWESITRLAADRHCIYPIRAERRSRRSAHVPYALVRAACQTPVAGSEESCAEGETIIGSVRKYKN